MDHSRLDQTVQVDAPLCSAFELDQLDLAVGAGLGFGAFGYPPSGGMSAGTTLPSVPASSLYLPLTECDE